MDVKAGDTLQDIRKSINGNGDNFGLSVNIVNTADGKAKLIIDSGVSGDGKDLTITGDNAELDIFSTGAAGSAMSQTQPASSAEIVVDGNVLKSDTNVFDDTIQDLKLTVLRVSDKDSNGDLKSNKVDITTDKTSFRSWCSSSSMATTPCRTRWGRSAKRSSFVGGVKRDDGGALAGDSTTRAISTFMSNLVVSPSEQLDLFDYL